MKKPAFQSYARFVVPLLSIAAVLVFIVYFIDFSFLASLAGFFAFITYCGLSVITGLRYLIFIRAITEARPPTSLCVTLPASMNLMSFVLPFKGGGIWLVFYLRTFFGIGVIKGSWLALVNAMMAGCLIGSIIWFPPSIESGGYFYSLVFFTISYILLLFSALVVYNRLSAVDRNIHIGVAFMDAILTVLYLLVLFLLVQIIVPDGDIHLQFGLVVLTISSMVIKITPGNVGVFEGLALLLMSIFPDTGNQFGEYVATYRILSLMHAGIIGIPSVLHSTDLESLKRLILGREKSLI